MDQTSSSAITVGAMEVRFLVEGSKSGGSVSVFECDVPADAKMPVPHSHDGFEETVCGLEGTTTWTIDGEQHEIGPRQAVCIPRGSVHGFEIRASGREVPRDRYAGRLRPRLLPGDQ